MTNPATGASAPAVFSFDSHHVRTVMIDDQPWFDASCGLTSQPIHTIKYKIKASIGAKLPELPEHEELKLFFQGRDAWTYTWRLLEQDAADPFHRLRIEVDVKLKKEFCHYPLRWRYTFSCRLELQPGIYQSVNSIREMSSQR